MAVPRHKHTRASVGQRRMHIHLDPAALTSCRKCGKTVRPHTVCVHCGYYKGREVLNVMAKLTKKEQKQRAKEIHETEQEHEHAPAMDMESLSKKP
ncbi:MAG: 50S ribosomal protein L32 [Candidatus Saccharimonadales bacterium]